jgi:hypothetical protein
MALTTLLFVHNPAEGVDVTGVVAATNSCRAFGSSGVDFVI